jgi:hypothetical protein
MPMGKEADRDGHRNWRAELALEAGNWLFSQDGACLDGGNLSWNSGLLVTAARWRDLILGRKGMPWCFIGPRPMSLLHAEQAAACELAMKVAVLLEAMVIEKNRGRRRRRVRDTQPLLLIGLGLTLMFLATLIVPCPCCDTRIRHSNSNVNR